MSWLSRFLAPKDLPMPLEPELRPRTTVIRPPVVDTGPPLWVKYGLLDLGFHETGNNRGIEKFINQAHCGSLGDPWCAIWVNAKLEQSGIIGTRSPSSQSFRRSNLFVPLPYAALGAIAVYWRGTMESGLGHVGFYLGETESQVLTLGGNESDAVRKQFEPKSKLFGYWWPKGIELPLNQKILVANSAGTPVGSVV